LLPVAGYKLPVLTYLHHENKLLVASYKLPVYIISAIKT